MDLAPSLYRRPLPEAAIPFSSPEGRGLFREALESGHLEGFFPLIEQFHTQADPAFCGLGSLVMVLNALQIDPGRVWRGPWRWFSEELLDCCAPLSRVKTSGLTLDEVACLARCNGAEVARGSVTQVSLEAFRGEVLDATRSSRRMLIASYLRSALGQTGAGHFSPLGGYHPGRDMLLVLDVARFKYPPHWVALPALYQAMADCDPVSGRPRGWLRLERRSASSAVAQFLVCAEGLLIRERIERLLELQIEVCRSQELASLEDVARRSGAAIEVSGIAERVRLRVPETLEQRRAFEVSMERVTALPLHRRLAQSLESEAAWRVLLWWLAAPESAFAALSPALLAELAPLLDAARMPAELASEVTLLRSQVEFLLDRELAPVQRALRDG